MNEKLFHEIAEQVEQEFMCSGLTGGLYEDFAKEILVRYLAAQHSVHLTRLRRPKRASLCNQIIGWLYNKNFPYQ